MLLQNQPLEGQLYKSNKVGAKNRLKVTGINQTFGEVTVQIVKNNKGTQLKTPEVKVVPLQKFIGKRPTFKLVKSKTAITGSTNVKTQNGIGGIAPTLGNTATY